MRLAATLVWLISTGVSLGQMSEPPGIHQLEWEAHRGAPVSADRFVAGLHAPSVTLIEPAGAGLTSRPTKAIFGYLPYWERDTAGANLRWDLLTHLACFSVGVNSNGTLGTMNGWPSSWTSLVNTAHANGVKVILVATNFTPTSIYTLITSTKYKNAFFTNITNQMIAGNADGLNIDFEGSNSPTWRSEINGFMAELTAYLHAQNPNWEVSFAGPAVNWSSSWDLPGLAASCDYIFIMGYAFYGSWSGTSGPCAPLDPAPGGSICIRNTVETQYDLVTHNTPDKLILGLPYYGGQWKTETSEAYSTVVSWVGSTRFRDDAATSLSRGLLWDGFSQTPWYTWHDGTDWRQVWFDNDVSLGLKYQLAQDHDYRGVGMWALNYDGSRGELWDELGRRFGPDWVASPPDLDGDGDVDQSDFGQFQLCLTGSDVVQWNHACSPARLDRDLDVDVDDAARFVNCLSGEGQAPASDCAQ